MTLNVKAELKGRIEEIRWVLDLLACSELRIYEVQEYFTRRLGDLISLSQKPLEDADSQILIRDAGSL